MPPIEPPATILFTGMASTLHVVSANGYFATYAVQDLLKRGYDVVGTVRSPAKGEEMKKLFAEYGQRLRYAVVSDITQPEAFDQVMKEYEFNGVAHAASPVNAQPRGTVDEFFGPIVDGTVNLLESVKKPNVKRVVYTSTCGAMLHHQKGVQHTEAHWNENSLRVVEEHGNNSSYRDLYRASKTLAEKAAWKHFEENKEHVQYDLVTFLPSFILGASSIALAPMHNVASRDQLTSTTLVASTIRQPRPTSEYNDIAYYVVHAKDAAALHSLAFTNSDAAGHRIIGVAADATWQDIYDALNENPAFPNVPRGIPGSHCRPDSGSEDWDTSYSQKLLGKQFIGMKQCFRETEEYYQKKGWAFMP
ncbi:NADPH-dependent aldehyde reductase ARI1 [Ceratobasidium sp. AG-Ba]|nr:NADPH-dependent aldehyde reductase ARI1 [Ceratobasidium sp. AG-Ba]QRW10832.1 NADPH-dependent aldehyde reductase ARI1 [Ceratobasidium sp. AG-Ba]